MKTASKRVLLSTLRQNVAIGLIYYYYYARNYDNRTSRPTTVPPRLHDKTTRRDRVTESRNVDWHVNGSTNLRQMGRFIGVSHRQWSDNSQFSYERVSSAVHCSHKLAAAAEALNIILLQLSVISHVLPPDQGHREFWESKSPPLGVKIPGGPAPRHAIDTCWTHVSDVTRL